MNSKRSAISEISAKVFLLLFFPAILSCGETPNATNNTPTPVPTLNKPIPVATANKPTPAPVETATASQPFKAGNYDIAEMKEKFKKHELKNIKKMTRDDVVPESGTLGFFTGVLENTKAQDFVSGPEYSCIVNAGLSEYEGKNIEVIGIFYWREIPKPPRNQVAPQSRAPGRYVNVMPLSIRVLDDKSNQAAKTPDQE